MSKYLPDWKKFVDKGEMQILCSVHSYCVSYIFWRNDMEGDCAIVVVPVNCV